MDRANLEAIKSRAPRGATATLSLLLDAVEGRTGQPVPDPYYGTIADFHQTWDLISEGVEAIAARLSAERLGVR